MRKQRLMGIAFLVISVLVLIWAATGRSFEERDATVVLATIPLGIYLLRTKDYVLYP